MANPSGKINSLITAMKMQYHLDKRDKDESSVALYANTSKKKPFSKDDNTKKQVDQSNSTGLFCKYCKKNHLIADCRKRIAKEKQRADSDESAPDKSKEPKQRFAYNAIESSTPTNSAEWIIDSGASSHMVTSKLNLTNYQDLDEPKSITLGNGKETLAIGQGEYGFEYEGNEGVLMNVLWVPELNENLFSVSKAIERGVRIEFVDDKAIFKHDDTITMIARKTASNVFVISLSPLSDKVEHANVTIEEWHRRFGHSSIDVINKLAKSGAVLGLKIDSNKLQQCENCVAGKITRCPHPTRSTLRASENEAVLQIDTCGPMSVESLGGSKFFVPAIGKLSNYKIIEFVSLKSEIANVVKRIINQVRLESKRPVRLIQTDNGSEFVNASLKTFLENEGILHERSAPYTPEQNGSVERANRVVIEGMKTLISDSKLPDSLWAEAAGAVVYSSNRLFGPKSSDKNRFELYFGYKPDVRNLRVFGESVYVGFPKPKRDGKIAEKGKFMTFVGYTSKFSTYKIYDPDNQIISLIF